MCSIDIGYRRLGGAIRYDPQPALKYRQHLDNLIESWLARQPRSPSHAAEWAFSRLE
jgi:hypothetical protein